MVTFNCSLQLSYLKGKNGNLARIIIRKTKVICMFDMLKNTKKEDWEEIKRTIHCAIKSR